MSKFLRQAKYTLVNLDKCLWQDSGERDLVEDLFNSPISKIPKFLAAHIKNGEIENLLSLLTKAIYRGNFHVIKMALSVESVTNNQILTAFRVACESTSNDSDSSAILLLGDKQTVDVESRNMALVASSETGKITIVEFLVKEGIADPTANGNECLIAAIIKRHLNVVQFLLQNTKANPADGNIAVIVTVVRNYNAEMVGLLLADGRADPNACVQIFSEFLHHHRFGEARSRLLRDKAFSFLLKTVLSDL